MIHAAMIQEGTIRKSTIRAVGLFALLIAAWPAAGQDVPLWPTLKLYDQGGHNVTSKENPWAADLGDWIRDTRIVP
jgi:hypothetical protein